MSDEAKQAAPEHVQAAEEPEKGSEQPTTSENVEKAQDKPMSKTQMKKQAKLQRMQETKADRKAKEKAKKAEKKAAAREERHAVIATMTEEQKQAHREEQTAKRTARKEESQQRLAKLKSSVAPGNQRIVIDLDFEGMMPEGDQRHLIQQLSYSYHANSSVDKPCHLHLLGMHGQLAKLADQILPSMANWHITRSEKKWHEHFADEKDKMVYLTADSPNEIEDLDQDKIYIIGGIVDHNKYKGLCFNRATAAGVATARLPIQKYVKLDTSAVLTVNHVVQILVEYVNRRDWAKVLDDVLPKRKRADWNAQKKRTKPFGSDDPGSEPTTGNVGATVQDEAAQQQQQGNGSQQEGGNEEHSDEPPAKLQKTD